MISGFGQGIHNKIINKMNMKKDVILLVAAAMTTFCSCGSSNQNVEKEDAEVGTMKYTEVTFNNAPDFLEDIDLMTRKFKMSQSQDDFDQLIKLYNSLDKSVDFGDIAKENRSAAKKLQFQLDSARIALSKFLEEQVVNFPKVLVQREDHLLTQTESDPMYLHKGDMVFVDFSTQGNMTVKMYNADSHSTLKTYKAKKEIHDSIRIQNTAIYVLEMVPVGNQYVDISVKQRVNTLEKYCSRDTKIGTTKEECTAKDFGAQKVQGIKISAIFEEPRKVTLRSQFKSAFSGGGRSIVAMQVPTGSTDIAYSLRISTSQSDCSDDGQFCKNMTEQYKKIKLLGLPIYESQKSKTNLFRELLNSCEPPREEEAYCNLYVFTNAAQAKKFADGEPISNLKYSVDLSKQGTQSCNDRISAKGLKTIYFGFENTRMRYSVYLWLESLATVPTTEYYRTTYKAE